MQKGFGLATAVALTAVVGTAHAADKIKIGVTATLEGTYTVLGEDGMRGYELAVKAHGGKAGGREIETIVGSTDASPDSAIRAAKKLVEQDKVDVLISPLSGAEGIAVRDYSKTQPQITVINASSGAVETTYGDPSAGVTPSPTFYRFNMDGAQWHAGLGDYVYNVKHYKKIATVAEDYAFTYTQVMGLTVEYCKAGGQISKRFWVPLGTKDFASTIAALPDDVDAIYLGLGGADAVNFLNQYQQAGGNAHLIGGSIMVDQTVLSSKGKAKDALIGTPAASGLA
ncbi:MAG TPA: ABC transporter substrate-binding protein, partial [Xanthobacteraceae bacterium]|nr:ABC transporter substrate-binding protein [Xanthobacteraceae bacterium]